MCNKDKITRAANVHILAIQNKIEIPRYNPDLYTEAQRKVHDELFLINIGG